MKRLLIAAAVAGAAFATLGSAPASAAVSVSVGQPGFYGRIDIGGAPPPQVVYAQPMIVHQSPVAVQQAPIYLRVPPGHQKNWSKHCNRYGACGQPVYFVQDNWYNNVYSPHYRQQHARGPGGRGDRDRDGVPNRYDRDRDGDGIPNRVDRQPNTPNYQPTRNDRDGDGIPNRADRQPDRPSNR